MAKKKHIPPQISQEDTRQAQQVLQRYHQVAGDLHRSTDREQAETALTTINALPEGVQMALLQALSKERHTDAADVLVAINELGALKSARKEAKRSLIRLEGARIYPVWQLAPERTPVVQDTGNPPRFWKGLVTDSRDIGEVQLLLCWEQGDDYRDVRILSFLLEFWHDGVKDFFTRIESKRSFERLAARMAERMTDVELKECSLAQGRRLILDALEVNKRYGTMPHKDYRFNLSLVNQLVLEAPDIDEAIDLDDVDLDDESEELTDLHGLSPQKVVTTFIESWVDGEYDIAYDLLTVDSPLREGLSQEEWMQRRDSWVEEADPRELEPGFLHERGPKKSGIWLPNPFRANQSATTKEIEIGWSIELDDAPLSETLPELPRATAVYEETGRHWFWSTFILVQEEDEWRIQSMIDEGANAQSLSIEELQKRVREHDDAINAITKKHKPSDPDAPRYYEEIIRHLTQIVHYTDVLIKLTPDELSLYREAAARMIMFQKYERSLVYLEPMTTRFSENRAAHLKGLAAVQRELSTKYEDEGDEERAGRCLELAEEALREVLTLENTFAIHISLAEILIDEGDHLDEAEDRLLQARALASSPEEEAHIELHLGEIAAEREQYQEALNHYQHVVEHDPTDAGTWAAMAHIHEELGDVEEAEANYRRAIEADPGDEDLYYGLSQVYTKNGQPEKAIEAIEEGLRANPDSSVLSIYLATVYMESGDYRQARRYLEKAERIDPDAPFVPLFRQVLDLAKAQETPRFSKPDKPKKRRR